MHGRVSGWSFGRRGNLECFLEGPAFDRAGNLYLVDIPYGRILRISPDGARWSVVAEYDGWPNGLAIHRDGRIFIADHRLGLLVLAPQGGAPEVLLEGVHRERFRGLNDLHFASNGDLYFTDQGQSGLQDPTGRVYRLRADGGIDCLIDNVPGPNGLALSTDESVLFVAATRANQVWRLPLHADGTTSKVGAFVTLNGPGGPDGIALDRSGGLAISHVGRGVVWLFDRYGDLELRITSPDDDETTNVAFGGPDGTTLFITGSLSGTVLAVDMPQPGQGLFSHA
jgi:gluconolactonase